MMKIHRIQKQMVMCMVRLYNKKNKVVVCHSLINKTLLLFVKMKKKWTTIITSQNVKSEKEKKIMKLIDSAL